MSVMRNETHPPASPDPSEEGNCRPHPLLGGVARRAGVGAIMHITRGFGHAQHTQGSGHGGIGNPRKSRIEQRKIPLS